MEQKNYMTILQVANYYNVSTKTIRNWIVKGMPHIRVGNVMRFNIDDVESWVKGNE